MFVRTFSLNVQDHLLVSFESRLGRRRAVSGRFKTDCVSGICEMDNGRRFGSAQEEPGIREADSENDFQLSHIKQ